MKTSSASEDWLAVLLWTFETIAFPTTRNILESFDSWNYRTNLRPHLQQLKRARLLEKEQGASGVWRLTDEGRLAACGGVDAPGRWRRPWDGRWRFLLFDVPARQPQLRMRLWRWLRSERFGYLQQSVWVSPDAMNETNFPLRHLKVTPEAVTVIEGRPVPPDSDEGIVDGAWDFAAINRHYERVIGLASASRKVAKNSGPAAAAALRQWLAADRRAWTTAVAFDPFLPEALLPKGYLGREAWEQRQASFKGLARQT